jgi:hypothetical protein
MFTAKKTADLPNSRRFVDEAIGVAKAAKQASWQELDQKNNLKDSEYAKCDAEQPKSPKAGDYGMGVNCRG